MREATGNALLIGMVSSIIGIIMIFFVGSISYSKSYRIKNYIINQIEENGGWDENVKNNVNEYLKNVGYHIRKNNSSNDSYNNNQRCTVINNTSNDYDYYIYECRDDGENKKYYKVVTFTRFDFPVVGEFIKFSIKGETKIFSKFN